MRTPSKRDLKAYRKMLNMANEDAQKAIDNQDSEYVEQCLGCIWRSGYQTSGKWCHQFDGPPTGVCMQKRMTARFREA